MAEALQHPRKRANGSTEFIANSEYQRREYESAQRNKERKEEHLRLLLEYLGSYDTVMILDCSQATSAILAAIRSGLRAHDAVLTMCKQSIMRKAIEMHAKRTATTKTALAEYKKLQDQLAGSRRGLIFTNDDFNVISDLVYLVSEFQYAKVGQTCPVDVFLRPGITNLEPTKTSFIPALNIASKITGGKIEILSHKHLIQKGGKVGASEASLLRTLNIKSVPKRTHVLGIFIDGFFNNASILNHGAMTVLSNVRYAARQIEAISAVTGIPTVCSMQRYIMNGYTNLLSVVMATDYKFEHAEMIMGKIIKNKLDYI
eukprot:CAMPEP_0168522342 /NCGR_PEP_ID=MMETSP0405-20121227/9291_1 /TAXON_ID=498012 /ORGANISM="Trichosphaerium sp, Strain Am-I-7 wt" /LENGTH=315 /DNA_ID=CAMNT_0008543927 /DNA_START=19 /DNA_END=966 /DNA_ORIENTATION=-